MTGDDQRPQPRRHQEDIVSALGSQAPVVDRKPLRDLSHAREEIARLEAEVTRLKQVNGALLREVRERSRAEDLVRWGESRIWDIVAAAAAPIMAHAEDGEILAVSNGFVNITGYPRATFKHVWDWLQAAYGERAEEVEQIIRSHFAHDRPVGGLELEVRTRRGLRTWIFTSTPPQRLIDGRKYYVVTAEDVTERRAAESALRESEKRARERLAELEVIYREAPIGLALFDRDLRFVRINKWLADLGGASAEAHVGRSVFEIGPNFARDVAANLRRVFATGEAVQDVELSGETQASPGDTRWWIEDYYPLKRDDGTVVAVGAIMRDVTERKRAEAQRELLLAELAHRVKNTLAAVQSIAAQTLLDGKNLGRARQEFLGRLFALSNVHDVLADTDWSGAALQRVVKSALEPFIGIDARRGVIEGPDLLLKPRAALTLALVVHELATNAAKYGALSVPQGRLKVTWRIEQGLNREGRGDGKDDRALVLLWCETCGPQVRPPTRSGFGRSMIERGLSYDLDGTARMDFQEDGLRCELDIPLIRMIDKR